MDDLSLKSLVKSASGALKKDISFFCGFNNYYDIQNKMKQIRSAMFLTKDDQVYSVGYNNEANLLAVSGNDFKQKLLQEPELVQELSGVKVRKIIIMEKFGAALTADGKLLYWGIDMKNAGIGIRTQNDVKLPYQPSPDLKVRHMACSAHSIVVSTEKNEVLLWGYLGEHVKMREFDKVPIGRNVEIRKVSCGWYHVALLDSNGHVWTFGRGSVGQLGYRWQCEGGHNSPKKVKLPLSCQEVECGSFSSVFLLESGEVYASGRNEHTDYLCVGRTGIVYTPLKVLLNDTITHVAAAFSSSSRGWFSLFSAYSGVKKVHYKWGDDPESVTPNEVKGAAESLDVFDLFRTPQSLSEIHNEMKPITQSTVLKTHSKLTDDNVHDRSILIKWGVFDGMPDDLIKNVESFKVYKYRLEHEILTGAFIITYDDDVYFLGLSESFELLVHNEASNMGGKMDPIKVDVLSNKNILNIFVDDKRGVALSRGGQLYEWSHISPVELVVMRDDDKVQQVVAPPLLLDSYCYLTDSNKVYLKILKHPDIPDMDIEIEVPEKIVTMSCGRGHYALLTEDSSVFTYSFSKLREYNLLGYDWKAIASPNVAKKVELPGLCRKAVCGSHCSIFLMENGEVYACGAWAGVDQNSTVPLKVAIDEPIVDVSVLWVLYDDYVRTHNVAVGDSGVIYKWGLEIEDEPRAVKWVSSMIDLFENQLTPQIHLRPVNSQDKGGMNLSNTFRQTQPYAPSLQWSLLRNDSIFEKWQILENVTEDFANKVATFKVYKHIILGNSAFMITYDDEVYFLGDPRSFRYLVPNDSSNIQDKMLPRKVDILCKKNIVTMLVSRDEGLALSKDGRLYEWGRLNPLRVLKIRDGGRVQQLVAHSHFAAYSYLTNKNNVYYKFIGTSDYYKKMQPLPEKIVEMACGDSHCALLTADSSVFTYSFLVKRHPSGLGYDPKTRASQDLAKKVDLPGPCKKLVCGGLCSLFLMGNGEVYACGWGSGVDVDIAEPQKVIFDESILDIDVVWNDTPQGSFNVAVAHSGVVYMWGLERQDKPEAVEGVSSLIDVYVDRTSPEIHFEPSDVRGNQPARRNLGNSQSCKLFGDPLYSDVIIKLSDGVLPAHRIVLHTNSRLFREMLSSKRTAEDGEIDFKHYKPNAARLYIEWLYGGNGDDSNMTLEELVHFHALAKKDGNLHLFDEMKTAMGIGKYLRKIWDAKGTGFQIAKV